MSMKKYRHNNFGQKCGTSEAAVAVKTAFRQRQPTK